MEALVIFGETDYQALCLAAKSEEKRIAALKKLRQYQPDPRWMSTSRARPQEFLNLGDWSGAPGSAHSTWSDRCGGAGHQQTIVGRCWKSDQPGHRAADFQANLHQWKIVGHC